MATEQFPSVDAAMHALARLLEERAAAARAALWSEATAILAEAQRRVPVDTGDLRDSGAIEEDPATGALRVVFTAGHSLIVHEDLEANHPDGQAKYLESVMVEAESGLAARMAEDIQRNVK
ncbi:MAG TPA: HK97 gp10 family phage protein [Gemmatimonadaceae bacterium]|nr:HK97 gp10 family phage protein [Gemmatimonadaceae bacterium]